MPEQDPITHIALVGGGHFCKEVLETTISGFKHKGLYTSILAVADPDPESPGMVFARDLGMLTFNDYHDLYDPQFNVHLIIVLDPAERILNDILATRPSHIRIMSHNVFEIFWRTISLKGRRLRERNKEIETILNGIQEFILVITPEKEIIDVNQTFLEKMCYVRDEVIGKKCYEIYQKSNAQCSHDDDACPLNEVVRNHRPVTRIMNRFNQQGEQRYIEISIFPIWESDGKISKFIEISRDVTERKKEEEEITRRLEQMVEDRTRQLKETSNKLMHQDKMASLGKLAASVVHEINNPNAGILNLIMLLKRIIEEESIVGKEIEQFNQYLSLMETETRRIGRIVSNLLAFSRQSKLEPKHVNCNKLIEKTLFLNSNLLKINGIIVEKQLDPNLPQFFGEEDQLQQVFMNLISNAVEAMEELGGGVLNIKTEHPIKSGKIIVSFKDSGVGIPSENLSKLFEPFFTTKKKGKGVGLGLSVAYGIIQEHGGSIKVKSEQGKGATFTIEIPLFSKQTLLKIA